MKKLALLGAMFALPLAANAHNYNYLEVNYLNGEVDLDGDDDFEGMSIHAKRELGETLFVDAGAATMKLEELGGLAIDTFTLGLGAQTHITEAIGAYGVVSYERGTILISDGGYGLAAGLRGEISDTVELSASYKHVNYGDNALGSDFESGIFSVGAVFGISDRCGLTVGYQTGEYSADGEDSDVDGFNVGLRMNY